MSAEQKLIAIEEISESNAPAIPLIAQRKIPSISISY